MSFNNPYYVGISNVGSYQVSGMPYATSSIAAPSNAGTPTQVDFYTPGTVKAFLPGGTLTSVSGTSASVQSAAVYWATVKMVKPKLTYDEIYTLLKTTSTLASNAKVKNGSLINIEKATK